MSSLSPLFLEEVCLPPGFTLSKKRILSPEEEEILRLKLSIPRNTRTKEASRSVNL
jgi:hypothetical protein